MQAQAAPNRLSELRKARGDKLVQIAAAVDVDQSNYWRWENRRSAIPDEKKVALARYFGVSVGYLMRWEEAAA